MEMRTISKYNMRPAAEINTAIAELPIAEAWKLTAYNEVEFEPGQTIEEHEKNLLANTEEVKGFKAIRVKDAAGNKLGVVSCPTQRYHLVQHAAVFRPIIEGLTLAGTQDFQFILRSTESKAELQLFTGAEVGKETVQIGFFALNSFDGSSAINYGFAMDRAFTYIEVVGWRQVCSNGMKIRVPLNEAEIITNETRQALKNILTQRMKIRHTESAEEKIKVVQYITEALALLRQPVQALITRAQGISLQDQDAILALVLKHVGSRYKKRVLEQFSAEEQTLWGLYNAVTYVASHDENLKPVTTDNLIDKAANLLMVEAKR